VVNVYDFFVGIKLPLGIIGVLTPPTVSIPKVNGVASIITKDSVSSEVSPQMIPP
jgi:hypothetical protein